MPHTCVGELGQHCSAPNHYLSQCWVMVNWTLKTNLSEIQIEIQTIFIHENAFENVVCGNGGHFVQWGMGVGWAAGGELTLKPTWVSNHMHGKVWDEIIYPFSNFSGATVWVWECITNFIPHHLSMLGFWDFTAKYAGADVISFIVIITCSPSQWCHMNIVESWIASNSTVCSTVCSGQQQVTHDGEVSIMKVPWDECHWTSLMINQHWFR